jgi:hypothetical protein
MNLRKSASQWRSDQGLSLDQQVSHIVHELIARRIWLHVLHHDEGLRTCLEIFGQIVEVLG